MKNSTMRRHRKKSTGYPFADWFRKDRFVLVRGKQYTCRGYIMGQQLRNAAKAHGVLSLSVSIGEDRLVVTVKERRVRTGL